MKKYSISITTFLLLLFAINLATAQNVGINEDNSSPNSKAILDVKSTTKGVLLPRMTTNQRTSMSLNLTNTAMVVYDTDLKNYFFWDGMEWEYFGGNYWMSNTTGIHSFPTSKNVGIGDVAYSLAKFRVVSDDNRYGISTNVSNLTNNSIVGHFIQMSSSIDATQDGLSINMSGTGGVGIKRGVRSIVHLAAGQTQDAFGLYGQVNGNIATNNKYGVYGTISGSADNSYGVYGKVNGANNYAIYGENLNTNGFGGFFDGKVAITNNLGLGQSGTNDAAVLDIDSDSRATGIDLFNDYDGNNPKWGIYNIVSGEGTGNHYGTFSRVFMNANATLAGFGTFTEIVDNGPADTYALFSRATGDPTQNNWAGYFDGRVQIVGGTTATLPRDGHLMLGESNSTNLVLDDTRIIARNNGAASNLFLNPYVGDVVVGSPTNTSNFRLNVSADSGQDALRVGVGVNTKLKVLANGATVIGSNATANIPANGLYVSGNVRLGYTGSDGNAYKLAVNGKMLGEELRIEDSSNWPDYVFADDYQLKTLDEVEAHINQYSHLPGIPSAKVVEAEGILVGDMQKKMMEKIEELTLYLIEMKKENEALKSRVEILESK